MPGTVVVTWDNLVNKKDRITAHSYREDRSTNTITSKQSLQCGRKWMEKGKHRMGRFGGRVWWGELGAEGSS